MVGSGCSGVGFRGWMLRFGSLYHNFQIASRCVTSNRVASPALETTTVQPYRRITFNRPHNSGLVIE